MQKERYFTPETLQNKSQNLLSCVAESRKRHAGIRYRPDKSALLVLDLQEYFLLEESHAFVPSASAILPGISTLISVFLKKNYPVIATRHLNTPEDAGMMSKWWRDLIDPRAAHSQNVALVNPSQIRILNKPQYDSFLHTPLESILRHAGVEQVIICGVMTHLCCETTARSAFMRGFEVFFPVDGTATYNEQLHRASLLTLAHGFAIPVLIDELVNQLDAL